MNRKLILLAVMAIMICPLLAGDTAVFVDLGFSADGRTYMFGQYGVSRGSLRPWAELGVVDVASNNFVRGGRINYIHDSPITAGHDGSGALYRIIARNVALADQYNIGYLLQGHLLFVSMENSSPLANDPIEFRNFPRSESFRATLIPSNYGTAAGSSFTISLERMNNSGLHRTYTVGSPGIRRPGIVSYHIRRVISDPRSTSIVFVIEMQRQNNDGSHEIRYMVETVRL